MKKISFITMVLLLSAGLIFIACVKNKVSRDKKPDVIDVSSDDKKMNDAMQKARDTIDIFKKALINPAPGQTYFSVKIRFENDTDIEHMWIVNVKFDDKFVYGTLSNDPVYIKTLKIDQEIKASYAEISDWMIIENNKLIGGYTIRVLRDGMNDKEKKDFDRDFGVAIE